MVDAGGEKARDGHHENHRTPHAQGSLGGLGHAQKGANAQNLGEDKVVDQDATNDEAEVTRHGGIKESEKGNPGRTRRGRGGLRQKKDNSGKVPEAQGNPVI